MAEGNWTAIGLSRDLEPGAVAGVIVEGREWALWRGASGRAHIWEDRCPHRGMRLSFGFVRGERLGCLYHGWQYDEAGQCRYIPAHPDLEPPATIRVPEQPVAESAGFVWAAFGEAPGAPPQDAAGAPVRSLYLDAPLARAVASLPAPLSPVPAARDAFFVTTEAGALLIAGHIVDSDQCALHIAIAGPPGEGLAARQRDHALWAERLRRRVEAGQ